MCLGLRALNGSFSTKPGSSCHESRGAVNPEKVRTKLLGCRECSAEVATFRVIGSSALNCSIWVLIREARRF